MATTTTTKTRLVDEAINFIKGNAATSFVELERFLLGKGVNTKGSLAMGVPKCDNLFIWFGMSREFTDLVHGLQASKQIMVSSTTPLVYFIDGAVPKVPIGKRAKSYKEERWFPIVFNVMGKKKSV